jgi:hypothetical protein
VSIEQSTGRQGQADEVRRKYLSQADVPAYGLDQALKIPQAIADNYAKSPTKPLRVAQVLGTQPTSSGFRMFCGARRSQLDHVANVSRPRVD